MKKNGIIRIVIAAAVTALMVLVAVLGMGPDGSGSVGDIKLGLDLEGGVSITYQTVEENPSKQDLDDTAYKLQLRVADFSNEAEVYTEGSNRINVDIPGAKNAEEILKSLGTPGTLSFKDPSGNEIINGDDIVDAQGGAVQNQTTGANDYQVSMTLNDAGSKKFAEASEKLVGKNISIYYDGKVVSSPTVQSAITGGQVAIEHMESLEAARTLASTIRSGALPLEITELHSKVVGAKLGAEAVNTSLIAGLIGFVLVIIFMCLYYRIPGVAASLALIIYTALDVIIISTLQITLTLPGIAGIILSIGMAVDANVVIFARIREEIGAGSGVKDAIKTGFQKALSAILDGNITTMIAAAVLYFIGSGTVRGFAQTLFIGIVISLITALVVTRFILNGFYSAGLQDEKYYGKTLRVKKINFLGRKAIFFAISVAVILVGMGTMVFNGTKGDALNYSLEFKGGASTNVTFNEELSTEQVQKELAVKVQDAIGDNNVQTSKVTGSNEVIIRTRTLTQEEREAFSDMLKKEYGVEEDNIQVENISATISDEMRADAVKAIVIATILMLIYIWIRFKDVRFAAGSVMPLIHDVLVVLGCYAVFRWSVGSTFIACMLTIVGYSINATIVIFDRIRENIALKKGNETYADVVNLSISQTLSRSINTSLTTFVMVAVLFILGVTNIREFALPLMVGIVCGGYSSVCLAGALWYVMKTKIGNKERVK
ncbi:SecD/SecF fusion protein [Cuneatibacter caecimuris]|uniref:Multifunctional fusion protein n=2 Tax=Cuneatibacter caecimuris TaxID=1796618 RepID=A0A4Q7PR99_9FIRM|nr:SecD/SecF fusion protein [Cuneatibacter caecimuris]